jgi:RNA polymerase sigma factor (sigma-70 family)
MEQHHTGAGFQTTHWSMVTGVAENPVLLEQLLQCYWGPIYAFVRRSGYSREAAADLTQEFIAQVVLERELILRADPERGRFRTFLKSALRNFLVDQHRRARAKGRGPVGVVQLGGDVLEKVEPCNDDAPDDAFDRQWAATILTVTLERLAANCRTSGQERHWAAFERAVIRPALGQAQAPLLEQLAQEMDLASASQVSSMIQTVRRKFRRMLSDVVAETVQEPGQAEEEMGNLRTFLGV